MATVTLDDVTKQYGDDTAVEEVNLTVQDGEVLGVIGPSGCGKTTTLRTIAGFETPTAGRVLFDDEEMTNVPPEQRNVGLVFQSYSLFDNMTVVDNVAFGLKMQGIGKQERRERAVELLELFDIGELADRSPPTLSGGQQQRVGLARALAIEPNILLLDEPMTGLDANLKTRLRSELGDLLQELNVTVLYVTHDQEEAMVMCDRIAVLNDGSIEQVDTPEAIYRRPKNGFVAEFVGTSSILTGTVDTGVVDLGFDRIDADALSNPPTNGTTPTDANVIVRPETFDWSKDDFSATLVDRFYAGERIRGRIELPSGDRVTVDLDRFDRVSPGEQIRIGIDPKRVHVLEDR